MRESTISIQFSCADLWRGPLEIRPSRRSTPQLGNKSRPFVCTNSPPQCCSPHLFRQLIVQSNHVELVALLRGLAVPTSLYAFHHVYGHAPSLSIACIFEFLQRISGRKGTHAPPHDMHPAYKFCWTCSTTWWCYGMDDDVVFDHCM